MQARVQKWGNTLAVRIPKSIAVEAGLGVGALVELSLCTGAIVIRPVARAPLTLEELLEDVTEENLHGEWQTGPAVGREAW